MTLMVPPRAHLASAIAPVLIERRFTVRHRCSECDNVMQSTIPMVDEPHEGATGDDFLNSPAVHQLPACTRCGSDHVTIMGHAYLRQPTDV
jgi:hypothetical protein